MNHYSSNFTYSRHSLEKQVKKKENGFSPTVQKNQISNQILGFWIYTNQIPNQIVGLKYQSNQTWIKLLSFKGLTGPTAPFPKQAIIAV